MMRELEQWLRALDRHVKSASRHLLHHDITQQEESDMRIDLQGPVPPQNPVDGAIVGVSVLGVKLAYPDASAVLRP